MSLNLTSKQTTIKLGSHKGEEVHVLKVDHLTPAKELEDTLNVTLVRIK